MVLQQVCWCVELQQWMRSCCLPVTIKCLLRVHQQEGYVACCTADRKDQVSACCVQAQIASEQERLANTRVQPDCALSLQANEISQQRMSTASSLADILRRPHVHYR